MEGTVLGKLETLRAAGTEFGEKKPGEPKKWKILSMGKFQVLGLNYFYFHYLAEERFSKDIVLTSETSERHLHHRDKIIQEKFVSREH